MNIFEVIKAVEALKNSLAPGLQSKFVAIELDHRQFRQLFFEMNRNFRGDIGNVVEPETLTILGVTFKPIVAPDIGESVRIKPGHAERYIA